MNDPILDILIKSYPNFANNQKTADQIWNVVFTWHEAKLKEIQFELLCNPDIYEAHANEHFEQEQYEAKLREELIKYDEYIYNHIHTKETSEIMVEQYLKHKNK